MLVRGIFRLFQLLPLFSCFRLSFFWLDEAAFYDFLGWFFFDIFRGCFFFEDYELAVDFYGWVVCDWVLCQLQLYHFRIVVFNVVVQGLHVFVCYSAFVG